MGRKLSPELDWIFLSLVFNESDFANCSQLTILLQGFAGTLRATVIPFAASAHRTAVFASRIAPPNGVM